MLLILETILNCGQEHAEAHLPVSSCDWIFVLTFLFDALSFARDGTAAT